MYAELRFKKGSREGERVAIEGATLVLGRSPLADVKINDPSLSRRHCMLQAGEGAISIVDLGSKNGTFVNGKRLEARRMLRGGDVIVIGSNAIELFTDADFLAQAKTCVACGREISLETFVDGAVKQEDETHYVCPQCQKKDPETGLPGFEIVQKLGTGSLGVVYEAVQTSLRRRIALKVLHARFTRDETSVKRFFREASAASSLVHPNIVQVFKADEVSGICYICMELVDGPSLRARIEREGPLPVTTVVDVGRQLADALQVAFKAGIVHRDIKPDNILLAGGKIPKLVDFGLAKSFENAGMSGLTTKGQGLGTLAYLPPEQLDDAVHADQRSDIYGLAATLYHALTGRPPFVAKSPRAYFGKILQEAPPPPSEIWEGVPPALDRVIMRALEKEKEKRYQTPAELRDELSMGFAQTQGIPVE